MNSTSQNATSETLDKLLVAVGLSGFSRQFLDSVWPFYFWLFGTLLTRFVMIRKGLDGNDAGILDKTIETLTHSFKLKRNEAWGRLLKKNAETHHTQIISFGEAGVSRNSIRRHSWIWFEWFVDCVSPKLQLRFEKPVTEGNGTSSKVPPGLRSLRKESTAGGFEFETTKRYDSVRVKKSSYSHNAKRVSVGGVLRRVDTKSQIKDDAKITLIYGLESCTVPEGAGIEESFRCNLFEKVISAMICFWLFGAGMLNRTVIGAAWFIGISSAVVLIVWFLCRPLQADKLAFCKAISRDAARIHEVGKSRLLEASTSTIDVLLMRGNLITWCRIGDSWISVHLPTEIAFWDCSLEIIRFVATTLMPGGWLNERNILVNLPCAITTILGDWWLPHAGFVTGVVAAAVLHVLQWRREDNGHFWILPWYIWVGGWFFGPRKELDLAWTSLSTVLDKVLQLIQSAMGQK